MNNFDHICRMITVNKDVENELEGPEIKLERARFDGARNKTFLFLLPKTGFLLHKYQDYFVNCFSDTNTKKASINGCIYILCKEGEEVREHILNLPGYIYNYYIGYDDDCKYFMYVLSVNDLDYGLITKSHYSKTSEEYKQKVMQFIYDKDYFDKDVVKSKSKQYKTVMKGILYKEDWLKEDLSKKLNVNISTDMEYWGEFSTEREFFTSKK